MAPHSPSQQSTNGPWRPTSVCASVHIRVTLAGETEDAAGALQHLYSGRSVHHQIHGWKTGTTSVRKERKWDTKYDIQKTEEERNPEANFS